MSQSDHDVKEAITSENRAATPLPSEMIGQSKSLCILPENKAACDYEAKNQFNRMLQSLNEGTVYDQNASNFRYRFETLYLQIDPWTMYSRNICIVQSSGTGKTRLALTLSLSIPSIYITLGKPNVPIASHDSIPRPDLKVVDWLSDQALSNKQPTVYLGAMIGAFYKRMACHIAEVVFNVKYEEPKEFTAELARDAVNVLLDQVRQKFKSNSEKERVSISEICKAARFFNQWNVEGDEVTMRSRYLEVTLQEATNLMKEGDSQTILWKETEDVLLDEHYLQAMNVTHSIKSFVELMDLTKELGFVRLTSEEYIQPYLPLPNGKEYKAEPMQSFLVIDESHHLNEICFSDEPDSNKGISAINWVYADLMRYGRLEGATDEETKHKAKLRSKKKEKKRNKSGVEDETHSAQGASNNNDDYSFYYILDAAEEYDDDDGDDEEEDVEEKKERKGIKYQKVDRVWLLLLSTTTTIMKPTPLTKFKGVQSEFANRDGDCFLYPPFYQLERDVTVNELDLDKLNLKDTRDIEKKLSQYGRPLWASYVNSTSGEAVGGLVQFVAGKLICVKEMEKICLKYDGGHIFSTKRIRSPPELGMDPIAFAICNYIIGTDISDKDTGIVSPFYEDHNDWTQNKSDFYADQTARHLRSIVEIRACGNTTTVAPSEPLVAIAAAMVVMYGLEGIADKSSWIGKKKSCLRQARILELVSHLNSTNFEVINKGFVGEFIARLLMTYAMYCAWPSTCESVTQLPIVTLREFLTGLVGEEEASQALDATHELRVERKDDRDFGLARVNFLQWCPFTKNPQGEPRYDHGIRDTDLEAAFRQCLAYICPNSSEGLDHIIPVAMPKLDHLYDDYDEVKIEDCEFSYIAVSVKWKLDMFGQPVGEDTVCSPPVYHRNSDKIVAPSALLNILMDLASGMNTVEILDTAV